MVLTIAVLTILGLYVYVSNSNRDQEHIRSVSASITDQNTSPQPSIEQSAPVISGALNEITTNKPMPVFFDPAFSVNELMLRVQQDDPTAKRNLVRFIGECANNERNVKNFDKLTTEQLAALPPPIVSLMDNCRQVPEEYRSSRSRLMLEAAKAGDKFALLNARYFPPENSATTDDTERWRSEIETLLAGKRTSDPDVACAIAKLYQDDRFGRKDVKKSLALYREILTSSPSTSQCFDTAKTMVTRLQNVVDNMALQNKNPSK